MTTLLHTLTEDSIAQLDATLDEVLSDGIDHDVEVDITLPPAPGGAR